MPYEHGQWVENTVEWSGEALPLTCRAAYLPGLFFLPLLTNARSNLHRRCASQGLWITAISVAAIFTMPYLLGLADKIRLLEPQQLVTFYEGWNAANRPGTLWGLFLLHCLILPLGAYVPVNSLIGFFQAPHSGRPYSIPLFGTVDLIPPARRKNSKEDAK